MGDIVVADIELSTIKVEGGANIDIDNWWEYNVSEQFPIKSSKQANGPVVIDVDNPHEGCTIHTTLINGKMNGESHIFSNNNVLMTTLTFVDGVATGPCTIYDDGFLFFTGYFKNGYREKKVRN